MTFKNDRPYTFAKGLLFKSFADRHINPVFKNFFKGIDTVGVVALHNVQEESLIKDWRNAFNAEQQQRLTLNYPRNVAIEFGNADNANALINKKADGAVVFAKENFHFNLEGLNWVKGITFAVATFKQDQDVAAIDLPKDFYHLTVVQDKMEVFKVDADFDGNTESEYFKGLKPISKKEETPLLLAGVQVLISYIHSRIGHRTEDYDYSEVMYYHFKK